MYQISVKSKKMLCTVPISMVGESLDAVHFFLWPLLEFVGTGHLCVAALSVKQRLAMAK